MAFIGFMNLNIFQSLFCLGSTIVLWVGAVFSGKDERYGIKVSVIFSAIVCTPFLYRLIARLRFVLEYGGMEGPQGYGSPLAFLIGAIFELLFFVPLFVLCIYGVILHFGDKTKNA